MKRRHLTPKAKAALWQRQGERCAGCRGSLKLADMQADHMHPLWCGGDNTDNWQGLCRACHAAKTKREAGARGKMNRLVEVRLGLKKPPRCKLQGRAFGPSRGFDKRLRQRLNGRVEVRT